MPLLKDLSCSIELVDDQKPLQELGTVYGDALVETFVPVPKNQQTFTVHLSGRNFIAPGIAMYVFIDGVYQCNRNRQDLKLRRPLDHRSLVDFKVRQKEERQKDGSMIAREWTFEKLDHASADGAPESCSPNILENPGCIEVVVLRCAGPRSAKTAANMNMDGVADYPDYRFDRDSRSRVTAYDDSDPVVSATSNRRPPPPPAPRYRSPYAETMRSRESSNRARSRYSEPVSPGTRPRRDVPAPGFQYGVGPIPDQSRAEAYKELMDETAPIRVSKPAPTVDPEMLEKIVADAVKRGVEESRKSEKPDERNRIGSGRYKDALDASSQVPGAWPTSPAHASEYRSSGSVRLRHRGSDRDDHTSRWDHDQKHHRSARGRAATHVEWDEEPEWDKQTKLNGWGSPDEAAWNTDETWSKERPGGWEEVRQRSKSRARNVREPSPPSRVSHNSEQPSERLRSRYGRSQKPRSKSRSKSRSYWVDEMKTSSDDNDGWTQVEAPSDTSTSLERSDSTLKPSHSRSQIQQPRSKSGRQGSRRQSQARHQRRLSQLIGNSQWQRESIYHASPPSMLVTNAPTVVSTPVWQHPTDVRSRKPSTYTQTMPPVVAPPPTWGCASDKARKNSAAATYLPPAPFSTIGEDHQPSRHSSGSSTWGVAIDKVSNKGSEKKSPAKQASWNGDQKSDKVNSTWGGADNLATGWNDAEQRSDGWNTNNNNASWDQTGMKDAAVDGFDPDNNDNGWGHDGTSKEQNSGGFDVANNNGWGHDETSKEQNSGGFDAANNNGWGALQDTNAAWNQAQDTTNNTPFTANAGNTWTAAATVSKKPPTTTEPRPRPKRHTCKSLSKYRQLSSTQPTPHWHFPPHPASKTPPPEPRHKIPHPAAALDREIQHQVRAGEGSAYGHAVSRPEYMDGLDKPYAVFRFKYRSRSVLRGMFGRGCLGGEEEAEGEEEDLEAVSREELIKRVVALRRGGAGRECREGGARTWTEEWVERHSGEGG